MEYEKQLRQTATVFTAIVQKTIDPAFRLSMGGVNKRALTAWLQRFEATYGSIIPERLVDFCVMIAHRYKGVQFMRIPQMFSLETFAHFDGRGRGVRYYETQWLQEHGLSKQDLLRLIVGHSEHPHAKYIYMDSEEYTKKRKLNQKVGFALCQTSTLGWSPLSVTCQKCDFTEACMKETKKKYPELYRLRIENGNNQRNNSTG